MLVIGGFYLAYEGAEKISENNEYKQQLFKNVKSSDITQKEILNLSYKKAPLTNYFLKYNNISSNSNEKEETKKSKNHVFIKITPGISTVSSKMKNDVASEFNTKLDNKIVFRFGAEVEYVLPTNKNKWSVFINPTYQKYENERSYNVQGNLTSNPVIPYKMEINYTSVQLPIGVRHYMFLNSNSKIFINASYSFDISTKTDITYTNMSNNSQVNFNGSSSNNIAFGLGYNFKNKFTAEARLNTTKELVNYTYYSAKYSAIDFIFGYTIF
ncbi:MAG: hypothetical protein EOO44_13625 [Flavobacterium sp.]|nr:MAG: hypothetical protein EOO44_13625 [Flavobacterium sp.]